MSALIEVPRRHWFKVSHPPPFTDLYQHELGSWTEPGTAWHCKHWHSSHHSRLFLFPLSLCPFSSPSCQISIHHKHWLFSSLICISLSYTFLAMFSAVRGGINCGTGDRGLCRKCMWVYASEDAWVQTGFNAKPKALPLGCLYTTPLGLIFYSSCVDLLFFKILSVILNWNSFDPFCLSFLGIYGSENLHPS